MISVWDQTEHKHPHTHGCAHTPTPTQHLISLNVWFHILSVCVLVL